MNQIYPLLLLVVIVSSCHGQNQMPAGQPKMVKPQGTDPYTSIRCTLQDKAGNLWFGTTGAGIYRYDGKAFINFTEKDGLSSNIVYCLTEDKAGNLLIGTDNGVCRYDGKTLTPFLMPAIDMANADRLVGIAAPYNAPRRSAISNAVFSMIRDKKGNLWFGTGTTGLYRYDGKAFTRFKYNGNDWKQLPGDSTGTSKGDLKNSIQCLLEDKAGNIWISAIAHGGVYRYDGTTFTHFPAAEQVKSHVFYMLEDKKGNIWFGTRSDGVYRYDGNTFTYFTEKDGFCNNNTTAIMEDQKGNIWFTSTFSLELGKTKGCVTRYDGNTFTKFPVDTLSNSSMWNVFEDKTGAIWLGSRNVTLYRYDGKSFTGFSEETGTQ